VNSSNIRQAASCTRDVQSDTTYSARRPGLLGPWPATEYPSDLSLYLHGAHRGVDAESDDSHPVFPTILLPLAISGSSSRLTLQFIPRGKRYPGVAVRRNTVRRFRRETNALSPISYGLFHPTMASSRNVPCCCCSCAAQRDERSGRRENQENVSLHATVIIQGTACDDVISVRQPQL